MLRFSNTARLWRHSPEVLVTRPWQFEPAHRRELAEVAVTALMEETNVGDGVERQLGRGANGTMKSLRDARRRDQWHLGETLITFSTGRLESELNEERRTI